MQHLDGNALAGALVLALGVDASDARIRCGRCGTTGALGALRVLRDGDRDAVRCRSCGADVLVVLRHGAEAWVELPHTSALSA